MSVPQELSLLQAGGSLGGASHADVLQPFFLSQAKGSLGRASHAESSTNAEEAKITKREKKVQRRQKNKKKGEAASHHRKIQLQTWEKTKRWSEPAAQQSLEEKHDKLTNRIPNKSEILLS